VRFESLTFFLLVMGGAFLDRTLQHYFLSPIGKGSENDNIYYSVCALLVGMSSLTSAKVGHRPKDLIFVPFK